MSFKVGTFSIPNTTGNTSVTGLGFTPKLVIFFGQYDDFNSESTFVGCADAHGNQWYVWHGAHTQSSTYTARTHEGRTDRCAVGYRDGGTGTTTRWDASFVSMDADGFTINITTWVADVDPVSYLAMGGGGIEDAVVGTVSAGSSTGATAVSGLGLQPNAGLFGHVLEAAFGGGRISNRWRGLGICDQALGQYSFFTEGVSGVAFTNYFMAREDAVWCGYDGTNTFRASITSWDSDGFTLNVDDAWTGDLTLAYCVMQLEKSKAGVRTQENATGSNTITGLGFEPKAFLFIHDGVNTPSSTGGTGSELREGLGAYHSSGVRGMSGAFSNVAPFGVFTSDGFNYSQPIIQRRPIGAGSSTTIVYDITITSLALGQFTYNVNNTDARARKWGWLALTDRPGALPQVIRYNRRPRVG